MSIDISNAGKYVFYLNFRNIGSRIEDKFCEAEQNFKFSELISKASDYIISLERFKIPIQSIPMINSIANAIQMIPKTAVPFATFNSPQSFSLYDFLNDVNAFFPGLIISLNADGRMVIDFNDFSNYSILLNNEIADIFDMEEVLGLTLTGANTIIGATPVFDRFDQLHKVQISSELGLAGIQQEIIDTDIFKNLLTDFLVPSTYGMSFNGQQSVAPNGQYSVQYNVRQDLEFNSSSNRRFIMMRSSAPVQNIKISATAVYRDGTTHNIPLPPRSIFSVKLAFWKK